MFTRKRDIYQYLSLRVNDWQGIIKVTQLVSTERLWLHFNFTILPGKVTDPMIFSRAKGLHNMAILTYLGEDAESGRKAQETLEKISKPVSEIKGKLQKRIPLSQTMPSINEELLLLGLWNYPQTLEKVGPTLPVAIVSAGYHRQIPLFPLLPETKLIYPGNDGTHLSEKNEVLLWMFEQHTHLAISPPGNTVLSELKSALQGDYTEASACGLF